MYHQREEEKQEDVGMKDVQSNENGDGNDNKNGQPFYNSESRRGMRKLWEEVTESIKRATDERFPLNQHTMDSDTAFVEMGLNNCVFDEPFIEVNGKSLRYRFNVTKVKIEEPTIYDPKTKCTRPLFPHEARWKRLNLCSDVYADIIFTINDPEMVYSISDTTSSLIYNAYIAELNNDNSHSKTSNTKSPSSSNIKSSLPSSTKSKIQRMTRKMKKRIDKVAGEDSIVLMDTGGNDAVDFIDNDTLDDSNRDSLHDSIQHTGLSSRNQVEEILKMDIFSSSVLSSSNPGTTTNVKYPFYKHRNLITRDMLLKYAKIINENENPDQFIDSEKILKEGSKCNIIEYIYGLRVKLGKIFVLVKGELCSIKASGGFFSHEDPDCEGGFNIVQGSDKVTENQFIVRGNHYYVHFQNSTTSQSQAATAAEATNTDSNATADSPIILVCDIRTVKESLKKYTSACHFYLMVEQPRAVRMELDRRMNARRADSESFIMDSSPSYFRDGICNIINHTVAKQSRGYSGFGENIEICFPNIKSMNFSLVSIMFLMGMDSRLEMVFSIANHEVAILEQHDLVNIETGELCDPRLMMQRNVSSHVKQCYLFYNEVYSVIFNQQLFPSESACNPDLYTYVSSYRKNSEKSYVNNDSNDSNALTDATLQHSSIPNVVIPNTIFGSVYQTISTEKIIHTFVGFDDMEYEQSFVTPLSSEKMTYEEKSIDFDQEFVKHNLWRKRSNFNHEYMTSKIDGWDRCSVLSHISVLMSRQGKKWNLQNANKSIDEKNFGNDVKRIMASFDKFSNSFIDEFLPHIGKGGFWRIMVMKNIAIASIIRKMMTVYLGYSPPGHVDNLAMKGANTPGAVMTAMYANNFKSGIEKVMSDASSVIEKHLSKHSEKTFKETVEIDLQIHSPIDDDYIGQHSSNSNGITSNNVEKSILLSRLVARNVRIFDVIRKSNHDHLTHGKGKRLMVKRNINLFLSAFDCSSKIPWSHICGKAFPNKSPFAESLQKGGWTKGGNSVMDTSGSTKKLSCANLVAAKERSRRMTVLRNAKGGKRLKGSSAQQLDDTHFRKICCSKSNNDVTAGFDVQMARACRIRSGYTNDELLHFLIRGASESVDSRYFNHFERIHSVVSVEKYFSEKDNNRNKNNDMINDNNADESTNAESFTKHSFKSPLVSKFSIPRNTVPVVVGGIIVGFTRRPCECLKALRYARPKIIPFDVSISWVGGPIGGRQENPLLNPFYNYIHLSGEWGTLLNPIIDMENVWKIPHILTKYSCSEKNGVYPNYSILPLHMNYSHLKVHPDDKQSALHLPFNPDLCSDNETLFDVLLMEGVICYKSTEESELDFICESMSEFCDFADYYMNESHHRYWTERTFDHKMSIEQMEKYKQSSRTVIEHMEKTFEKPITVRNDPSNKSSNMRWTGVQITGEFIFGITPSTEPFVNSNDPCRVIFSGGMMWQANTALSRNHKFKKWAYPTSTLLPKKSLSPSSTGRMISDRGLYSAVTPTLVSYYSDHYNGEDAFTSSESSYGRYDVRHEQSFSSEALLINELYDIFYSEDGRKKNGIINLDPNDIPKNAHCFINAGAVNCITLKSYDYSSVDKIGLPIVGTRTRPSSAIISRVLNSGTNAHNFRDGSVTNQSRMNLVIDSSTYVLSMKGGAFSEIVVKTSAIRSKEGADKYCTTHGQKGVCGVTTSLFDRGYTLSNNSYNSNFTAVIPAIDRGATGIPSRGTVSELQEIANSERAIQDGRIIDVSPFERDSDRLAIIERLGTNMGNHVMISSSSGKKLDTMVTVGVLDYRVMAHLSRETFNSRRLGAVDPNNLQPPEGGGKKGGGGKQGKLEDLNMKSQGVPAVSAELSFSSSDPGFSHVCHDCGLIVSGSMPIFLDNVINCAKMSMNSPKKHVSMMMRKMINVSRNIQGGSLVHSRKKAMVMNDVERIQKENNIIGNPIAPSGGYCFGCGKFTSVYLIRMPTIVEHLFQNMHVNSITWRAVMNLQSNKNMLLNNDILHHSESML